MVDNMPGSGWGVHSFLSYSVYFMEMWILPKVYSSKEISINKPKLLKLKLMYICPIL